MNRNIISFNISTKKEVLKEIDDFYKFCLNRDVLGNGKTLFKTFNEFSKPKKERLFKLFKDFCTVVYFVYLDNNKNISTTFNFFITDETVSDDIADDDEIKYVLCDLAMAQLNAELKYLKSKTESFSKN